MTDNLENEVKTSDGDNSSLFSGAELRADGSEAQADTNESTEKPAETQAEAEQKPEESQPADQESEKIVTTKEDKDAEAMRIREIEHRKAKRIAEQEANAKYEAEIEKIKQQVPQQPAQQAYVPPAPSPNHVWDASINQWLDPNMSLQDYAQLASQVQPHGGYNQQPINQQAAPVQQSAEKPQHKFSEAALNQADECMVRIKDFKEVLNTAPVSPEMAEAAALDPQGLKNLYQLAKDAPHDLYKILQLPVEKQKEAMWLMNRKFTDEKVEKFKSKATPQPAPLNNTGEVSKDESSMGVSELKRKKFAKYWSEDA